MTIPGSYPRIEPLDRTRFPVDEWALTETRYDPDDLGRIETLFAVGNGYLGLRGNLEEGRDTFEHGTFINGFHETWPIRHAEQAYGLAKTGQTIVNVPDPKVIRLYVDDEPLLLSVADMPDYSRSLDFRAGVLQRRLQWRTPSGKRVEVRSKRMVSLAERHLAVMTFEVELIDARAPVSISSQLLNRQDGQDEYHLKAGSPGHATSSTSSTSSGSSRSARSSGSFGDGFDPRQAQRFSERVLVPVSQWADEDRAVLTYRCANSGMTLAVAMDHTIETANDVESLVSIEQDVAKQVFRVDARPGVPILITKVVSYHTSRGVPPRELVDRCRRTLDRVKSTGVAAVFDAQRAWLDSYWERCDVAIKGQPELQQAIRWNLFQLAQAAACAQSSGVPAKGVTGSGYDGHYFWDTEIYVLPFLTYTSPRWARSALRFRYSMLPAARQRATEVTQAGALFPWRTINGEEASAYYAAGTAQYHIDADVSYALMQYLAATGDEDFVFREGVDVLVETARMWADLGFWRANGDDAFHIHGVTGPDEYTTVVNDNLFTNVMARFNLAAAVEVVRTMQLASPLEYERMVRRLALDVNEVEEWSRAADRMSIPYNEALGIHPQDLHFLEREVWDLANTPDELRPLLLHYHPLVIYRFQVLKQADVVLALILQGEHFTAEQKRANFEYYDPITTGDSTLSAVAQAIVAAEVGYGELAYEYFLQALFCDLGDLHQNTSDGVHVASAGGTWSTLVFGFGGMRDARGKISFDPRLPDTWDELIFRVQVRDTRIRVEVRQDEMTLTAETGTAVPVYVRGEPYTVARGRPVTVMLTHHGPQLIGRPTGRDISGLRRDDGTLMTPSVPEQPEAFVE